MKAIILAAGVGSRISDSIGPIPKSTLEINNKPIIRRTVEMLISKNIEVAVCIGYRYEKIEESLNGLNVKYFYNPFFKVTNNIASLWFAKDFICSDDCIILSADVVFEDDMLNRIMNTDGDLVMVVDSSRVLNGDYFLSEDKNGKIIEYGPNVLVENRKYEYVGICIIKRIAIEMFIKKLDTMINNEKYNDYFELIFFMFIDSNIIRLTTVDIAGILWREIDKIDDFNLAVTEF